MTPDQTLTPDQNLFFVLILAKYGADINNGIKMFESLSKENPDDKRDYIYYLAIAYCRIKDYPTAQKYVKAFLEIEPNNQQVLLLDVSVIQVPLH
jgi:mitochondrial fission 1 protein